MLIKEKDITSYQLLLIKQDRVLGKLKYLLLWLMNLELFFFTFRKKWVGRAMGNETFNWDGPMHRSVIMKNHVLAKSVGNQYGNQFNITFRCGNLHFFSR